ncbi:RlmF-related methyltransferase [Serratia proteamaculans]
MSLNSAKMIVEMNPTLRNSVRLRLQKQPEFIFNGIIGVAEKFDATLCNPPFHGSEQEAQASTRRKLHKLGKGEVADKPVQNFGGKNNELWCEGGEEAFVRKMVEESVSKAQNCLWFTSLISKNTTLPSIYHALKLSRHHQSAHQLRWRKGKRSAVISVTFHERRGTAGCLGGRTLALTRFLGAGYLTGLYQVFAFPFSISHVALFSIRRPILKILK